MTFDDILKKSGHWAIQFFFGKLRYLCTKFRINDKI
jgi:hypothetical protein